MWNKRKTTQSIQISTLHPSCIHHHASIPILPYRTKFRRTKVPKIWLAAKNFVRRKFCPPKYFVHKNSKYTLYLQIISKSYQTSVKSKMNKTFLGGQNSRNFELVPKTLSAKKFCPPKILSAEILSDKVRYSQDDQKKPFLNVCEKRNWKFFEKYFWKIMRKA